MNVFTRSGYDRGNCSVLVLDAPFGPGRVNNDLGFRRGFVMPRVYVRAYCTVDGCDRRIHGHGLCHMHRRRLQRVGRVDRIGPHERFWNFVDTSGDCWPWTGSRNRAGYGKFKLRGRSYAASRAYWMLFEGPITDGHFVCHRCDNPPCVRPDHLFLGTPAENTADKFRKGRQRTPSGMSSGAYTKPWARPKGERHGMARLSELQVREIRRRRAAGEQQKDLANHFGVHPNTIYRVASGLGWGHV